MGSKDPTANAELADDADASSSLLDAIAYAEKHYQTVTGASAPPLLTRNSSASRVDSFGLDDEVLREQRILMAKYEKDGSKSKYVKPSTVILPTAATGNN